MPENNKEVEYLGNCAYCFDDATATVKGMAMCQAHAEATTHIEEELQKGVVVKVNAN